MRKITFLLIMLCLCGGIHVQAQFTESFEGNGLPTGWGVTPGGGGENWQFGTYQGKSAQDGSKYAYMPFGTNHNDWLNTPTITVTANTTDRLSFWAMSYSQTYTGRFQIVITAPGVNKVIWDETPPTTWTKYTLDLSPYIGENINIWFHTIAATRVLYLDNVVNDGFPTCLPPTNLSVSNIDTVSADLDWDENNAISNWDLYVVSSGTPAPDASTTPTDAGITVKPFHKTMLSPDSDYVYYVRTNCGGGDVSQWAGPYSFSTPCVSYTAFVEDFESSTIGSIPLCWDVINGGKSNSTWSVGTPANGYARSGYQVMEIPERNVGSYGSSDDYIISPPISVGVGSSDRISFYARSYDPANLERVNILVSTTGKAPGDFTSIDGPINVPEPWTSFDYDLSAYAGQTIYVAVQVVTSVSGFNQVLYGMNIDDFRVDTTPSCLQPTNLNASGITSFTADLSWTDANTPAATTWDVDIELAGTPQSDPITATGITSNPYQATSLAPYTDYVFYVRANCGGGDVSYWSGPYSFKTLCAPYGSFTENFDSLPLNVLPDCWSSLVNSTDGNAYVKTRNSTNFSSPNNLEMRSYSDPNAEIYVITPELSDLANGTHQIRFFARGDSGDVIEVGTMSNPALAGTYTPVKSYELSSTYKEYVIPFNTSLTDTYLVIKGKFDGTTHYINIDDVYWEPIPSCPKPNDLDAVDIRDVSAQLIWTEMGTATTWDIELGSAGFTPTGTPTATGVGNPHLVTGLTANTAYEYYVRADCGNSDLSIWKGPYAFSTLCTPFGLPFLETFDDIGRPACWEESGVTSWKFSTGAAFAGIHAGDHTPGGGTNYAWVDGTNLKDGKTTTLFSPLIDISSLNNPAINFYVYSNNTNDTALHILDVEFYDGQNWNNILHLNTLLGSKWKQYLIDLSPYTITGDEIRVRFTVTGNSNGGNKTFHDVLVDDVSVFEMPACPQPDALTVSNITQTTADLGWVEIGGASSWDIELGPVGFVATGTPTHSGVTTNPYNVTTLNPCQTYEFYVRADCGGGDLSSWTGPFQFTTTTGPVGDFTEDFDSTPISNLPTCWNKIIASGFYSTIATSNTNSNSAPNSLSLNSSFSFAGGEMYLVTPELTDLPLATHQIRFFAKKTGTSTTLELGTMSNPNDENSFTLVKSIPVTTNYVEYSVPFRLMTTDKYIAFKVNAFSSSEGVYLDDVIWEELPLCKKPTNLNVSNITTTTATLEWDEDNFPPSTMWDVDIEIAGNPQAPPITAAATSSKPYLATNLNPATKYEFYVRADCGGGNTSTWTGPFAFTTACNPSGSFTEDFETTSVDNMPICWNSILNTTSQYAVVETDDLGAHSLQNCLKMYNYDDVVAELYAVLPELVDLSSGTYQLRFYAKASAGATLEVGTITDPMDETTYTFVQTVATSTTYQEFTVPFYQVTTDSHIAFKTSHSGMLETIRIDDVIWEPNPCPPPKDLNVSNLTYNSASLNWTARGIETEWDILYGLTGFDYNTNGTLINDTDAVPSESISGLSSNTTYDFYVRAVCGVGDTSQWVGPQSFTTPPPNDNLADAIPLTIDAFCSGPYTNFGATAEVNEPVGSCFVNNTTTVDNSVWFSFVAPASGEVYITTDISPNTIGNTQIAVYPAPTVAGDPSTLPPEIDCDQDSGVRITNSSVLQLTGLTGGSPYYIQVDGFNTKTGDFCIQVQTLADYIYSNGAWSPSDPSGNTTTTENLLVADGEAVISSNTLVNNITVNNSATLKIEGVLSPSGNLMNNGSIIFISNANGTGQLDDMTGSSIIGNGTITAQRFIPVRNDGKGAWRYLVSPITTSGSINDNWQEGATDISSNPNPGYGIFITGSATGANGFDAAPFGAPSMFTFDVGVQNWQAIPNTDILGLQAGIPYATYIWGDRSVDIITTNDPPATDVTLQATGNLLVGDYTFNLPTSADFYFIGNPYQSAVDMNNVMVNSATSGVNTQFYYVWDPNEGNRGAYVTWDLTANNSSSITSDVNQFLQPGQAVFISAIGTSGTLVFEENDKTPAGIGAGVFKENLFNGPTLSLSLFKTQNLAVNGRSDDGLRINFEAAYANTVDQSDAPKFWNSDENIARLNGADYLSIEYRNLPEDGEVLPLYHAGYVDVNYTHVIKIDGFDDNVSVFLDDAYINSSHLLSNGQVTEIDFSIDPSIAASMAPDRFSIRFSKKGLSSTDTNSMNFEIYPNPVSGSSFFISGGELNGEELEITLYDITGRQVLQRIVETNTHGTAQISLGSLQKGMYLLKMKANGKTQTEKLILE